LKGRRTLFKRKMQKWRLKWSQKRTKSWDTKKKTQKKRWSPLERIFSGVEKEKAVRKKSGGKCRGSERKRRPLWN